MHPFGNLLAATIDGRPLFESVAVFTTIADLVPERRQVTPPGSWSLALHDHWVSFALTEVEAWLQSTELNTDDSEFALPKVQPPPGIADQNRMLILRSATALDASLASAE